MKTLSTRSQGRPDSTLTVSPGQDTAVAMPSPQKVKGLVRAFIALRHRNFRLFWFGQMISLIGTWMQTTGQAWLVLELTHSGLQLGIVGALQFLPILLFSIFGGVFADRWPKRRVLLFTQSAALVQAAVLWLLVATGTVQLWHVYLLALLLGLTNSLDMPTRQAFVVEMVGREELPNAVALNSLLFNMARILGPGIGGLIIAVSGVGLLFFLNATSFIAVIFGLAMINVHLLRAQPRQLAASQRPGTWQSLREGLRYVRRTPVVLLIVVVVGLVSLFGVNFNVVLPLFATQVLNVGAIGFGFISAAFGAGALISALLIAWGNKRPNVRRMSLGALAFCSLLGVFALSHIYVLSLLLIAAVGLSLVSFTALANTILQSVSPDHLRGRVMSVYMLVFNGSTPIGNLLIGGLETYFGASIALLICAILGLIVAVAGWIWRKPAEKNLAEPTLF